IKIHSYTSTYLHFLLYGSCHRRDLRSFPTRRSSDLGRRVHRGARRCDPVDLRRLGRGLTRAEQEKSCGGDSLRIRAVASSAGTRDRKSTRLNSSHVKISYAVFCLKKKTQHGYVLLIS